MIEFLNQVLNDTRTYHNYVKKEQTVQHNECAELLRPAVTNPDIIALQNYYGELKQGRVLEIGLHDLLAICPRRRQKSDAFYSLVKELKKAYGVELRIMSRRNTNSNNESNL